ncbi:tetratricopeptide repeat protein [Fodinicurvata halophila]|uniref:Tetratricopeptide repeat protein n=1 Tax=Fodinicurvata halophila TaxID=1419723 RepID=A0ABV8UMT3_9PROT
MSLLRLSPFRCLLPHLALVIALACGLPALAQEQDRENQPASGAEEEDPAQDRYRRCMDLARNEPEKGLAAANLWQDEPESPPAAEHCAAEALIGLERYAEAAEQLRALADEVPDSRRAHLLADIGWAWMMAEQPEKAYEVQSEALEQLPEDVELYIDRSISLADMGRYWESVDDLNRAHDLAPERADILSLRASAYRRVDAPQLALDDILRARELSPEDVGLKIQEGIMRAELGQAVRAATLWQQVINAQPGTRAARIARQNLEQLEGPETSEMPEAGSGE